MKRPISILIAGGTGTGKSTLAAAAAHKLGIMHVIGTDLIREVIRQHVPRITDEFIHESTFRAWELLQKMGTPHSHDVCVRTGYVLHRRLVTLGIRAVLERCTREDTAVVVEGIHVCPECLAGFEPNVLYVCFKLMSEAEHIDRFERRARQQPRRQHIGISNKYLLEMRLIGEFIFDESTRMSYPYKVILDASESLKANVEGVVEMVEKMRCTTNIEWGQYG